MNSNIGEVRIPANTYPWPHEMVTAQLLASAGYIVEFLPVNTAHKSKSPDILLNNMVWEIKSPISDKLSGIERNLKKR